MYYTIVCMVDVNNGMGFSQNWFTTLYYSNEDGIHVVQQCSGVAECSSAIGGATAMHIQSQMSCQAILSCPTALHADDVGNKYYFDMTQQMVSWGKGVGLLYFTIQP